MEYNVVVILGAIIFPNFGSVFVHYVVHRNPLTKFWYKGLTLPKWMLPKWANRPLWLVLYSCMGFGSYLVWRTEGGFDGELDIEMVVYVIQLACNWIWPAIFFGRRSVLLGFVFIIPYTLSVYFCTYVFYLTNHTAACLMAPYACWTTYTLVLMTWVFRKNYCQSNDLISVNT